MNIQFIILAILGAGFFPALHDVFAQDLCDALGVGDGCGGFEAVGFEFVGVGLEGLVGEGAGGLEGFGVA